LHQPRRSSLDHVAKKLGIDITVHGGRTKELGVIEGIERFQSIAEFRVLTTNFNAEYGNYSGPRTSDTSQRPSEAFGVSIAPDQD